MIYLANGFSPSMLSHLPLGVEFKEVDKSEFCDAIKHGINSIGHSGTIDLVNKLCGTSLNVNRISIKVEVGDEIYIILLTVRLEEGKILKSEEIEQMYAEGKVKLVKAKIYGAVLEDLTNCEDKCDEITYDSLANRAKNGGEEE